MKLYSRRLKKLHESKRLKLIRTVFIILLLSLTILIGVNASSNELATYGKDNFREEFSSGYIRDRSSSDVIRTSPGISVKLGPELKSDTDQVNTEFYTANNTSKSEYIDYSKAARYVDSNGNPVWLDMRVYIWTNNANEPWAVFKERLANLNFSGYMNAKVIQHTTMEFHFYTAGHCGEDNYEQSFKGVFRVTDLDTYEGVCFLSGYDKFYLTESPSIIYVAKGSANSSNANNPFSKDTAAKATDPYFFGTKKTNELDNIDKQNVWVEIDSTPDVPFKYIYGTNGRKESNFYYTGTAIEYYADGVQKDIYYCVPYGTYKLMNPSKIDEQKEGYSIDVWYTNTNYNVKAQDGIAGTSTIKVYGRYRPNKYTITYNGNGATNGSTTDSNYTYDVSQNLNLNGFEKKYTVTYNHNYRGSEDIEKVAVYTFENWNTEADGTGINFNDNEQIENLTSNDDETINLYAIWSPTSISYEPIRKNYVFAGWYSDSKCTNKVTDNEYTPTEDITLYAKWEEIEYIKEYTITIENSNSGHTYNSYQVFKGDYYEKEDEDGKKIPTLSNIEWGTEFRKIATGETEKTYGDKLIEVLKDSEKNTYANSFESCQTAEDVAKVLQGNPNDGDVIREFTNVVGKYILDNNITLTKGTDTLIEEKDTDGNIKSSNYKITQLEPGYYIVIDAQANEKDDAYSRYLIDVVQDVTMTPKSSIPTLAKKVKTNNVEKEVIEINEEGTTTTKRVKDETVNTATYQENGAYDIEFEIVTTIPTNLDSYGNNYEYKIVDILSKGFEYNRENVKVYIGENKDEYSIENYTISDITITEDNYESYKQYFEESAVASEQYGKTLIIINIKDLPGQLKNNLILEGQKITINYKAKLNEKHEVGNIANINEAYLQYSNDPYIVTSTSKTKTSMTSTYTIDLNLSKIAELKSETDEITYLSGAEFEIYSKPNTVENREPIATITTDEMGEALYSSLGAGTYYIKETKSPEGYNKLREEIEIEVKAVCDEYGTITWSVEEKNNNNLLLAQIGAKEGTEIPEIKLQVENTSGFQLPVTGGIGRAIFTVIGISVMAVAIICLESNKKK